MGIVSAVGQPEAAENRKAITSLLTGMRPWLQQGAAIEWKPAEFEAMADLLTRFEMYDLLRDYAEAACKRDPANPAWRFHAIVAHAQGLPYRLTMREEDEVATLAKAAVDRQDFHMLSRINRFMEGDADLNPRARRRGHRGPDVELDDLDDDQIMALFSAVLTNMPSEAAANLRRRVNELGREQALTELVGQMKDPAMGPGLPEPMLRELCAAMIAQAMQGGGSRSGATKSGTTKSGAAKSAGGRQRSFF